MTKDIILAAVFVIITISTALFVSDTVITFKPFRLHVQYWHRGATCLVFAALGVLLYIGWSAEYRNGYEKGLKDGGEKAIQYIYDKVKNNGKQHQ